MNVLYEFQCGATYLAEVSCGEQSALAGTSSSAGAAPATCCCVVQRCPPPTLTGVATDHALARCTAFVEAHREGLRVVRAMYGCCGDGDGDSLRETVCQTSRARCDAATPLPDLDTLCPHTAPLTPTALLSAAFALPPLTRVELARTPSPMRDATDTASDAAAAKERVPYLFYCYAPYATHSTTRDGHSTGSAEGQDEWRWLQSRFSTWYGFTSTLSCVLYDCAPAERARFTLAQYMRRAATTRAGGAPDKLAESSVLAWGEEMLWRLLSALLSSLALLHSAGLTLHGQLQAGDVVCFAVPACTSARLQDAATAVWSARGAGSESARERVRRYMEGAARDVVLRDAAIGSRTPCHRAFFVLTQLPELLMENAGVASAEDGSATSEAGAGDFAAGTRADIAAVGRLVRAVAAEQRRLVGGVGHAAPAAPSSELDVVIERLTAAAAAVAETGDGPAQPALSAAQLVRLQALRLRVSRWTYQSIAEDRQMLARFCAGGEAGRCGGRHAAAAPGGAGDDARTLHARAALLAEREAKLDVFLQLYELTHEQLDSLPRLGPAAPGDACAAAAALLQARLQQGVRDATAMAIPTPRQSPAAAGAVRRRSPLLSPARDEVEAARVAASLHALATSVARDEAGGLWEQAGTRRGPAQEVEVELSVEEQAAGKARARPTAVSACAASPSPSLAAVTPGRRDGRATHPTLRLRPYDAATPFHHHHHPRSPRPRTDDGWFARQLGVLEELRTSFAQSATVTQRGGLSGRSSGSASRARVPTALGHTLDRASPRHDTRVAVSAAASLRGSRDAAGAKAVGGDGGAGRGRSAGDAAAPEMRAGVWDARPAHPSGATAHGGGTPTSSASLGRTPRHDLRDSPAVTSATGRSPDAHRRDAEDEAARELLTRLRGGVALTARPRQTL